MVRVKLEDGKSLSFPFYQVVKIPVGSSFYASSMPVKDIEDD